MHACMNEYAQRYDRYLGEWMGDIKSTKKDSAAELGENSC